MKAASRPLLMALLATATLQSCDPPDPAPTDVPARIQDSAGVQIVEYAGMPEVEPTFAIADEPVYRHGTNPGDYEVQSVNVGRLFSDGSAVVADRENSELVVLSPDGATHEVLARHGEGPGDVIYPYSMFVVGQDSVLVPDRRQSRITLFVGDSVARIREAPPCGPPRCRGNRSIRSAAAIRPGALPFLGRYRGGVARGAHDPVRYGNRCPSRPMSG